MKTQIINSYKNEIMNSEATPDSVIELLAVQFKVTEREVIDILLEAGIKLSLDVA